MPALFWIHYFVLHLPQKTNFLPVRFVHPLAVTPANLSYISPSLNMNTFTSVIRSLSIVVFLLTSLLTVPWFSYIRWETELYIAHYSSCPGSKKIIITNHFVFSCTPIFFLSVLDRAVLYIVSAFNLQCVSDHLNHKLWIMSKSQMCMHPKQGYFRAFANEKGSIWQREIPDALTFHLASDLLRSYSVIKKVENIIRPLDKHHAITHLFFSSCLSRS